MGVAQVVNIGKRPHVSKWTTTVVNVHTFFLYRNCGRLCARRARKLANSFAEYNTELAPRNKTLWCIRGSTGSKQVGDYLIYQVAANWQPIWRDICYSLSRRHWQPRPALCGTQYRLRATKPPLCLFAFCGNIFRNSIDSSIVYKRLYVCVCGWVEKRVPGELQV